MREDPTIDSQARGLVCSKAEAWERMRIADASEPARAAEQALCSIPITLVDRRLEILTSDLRQLPAQALLPLRRLVSEGKMMADRESADHRTTRLSIDDVDAIELKPNFFGIGLNLNHLIKRLGHWRTKRKSQST